MRKQELRKLYKQKRVGLSEQQINRLQKSIYQQVFELDFSQIQTIHVFLPIERQKEINTYPIIEFLRKENKQVIISKSDFKTNTLTHFLFQDGTKIAVNNWGIPEPEDAQKIGVTEIDLVFVPLLISDERNYRVGYGKGFYDRFLSECKPTVKTIGLNFFSPIHKIEDVNEFDMALDKVVYPKE